MIAGSTAYAITGNEFAAVGTVVGVSAFSCIDLGLPYGITSIQIGVRPTQSEKLAYANKKVGNPGVAKQQGTTRIIYDTLPLDGRSIYEFFQNASQRAFPRTNLGGNQFTVGESMVIKRMSLSVLTFDAVTGQVTAIQSLDVAGATSALYAGDLNILVANNRVLKDHSLIHMKPEFNKDAGSTTDSNYKFYTDIVIPSLINLVFSIRVPVIAAIATKELRLTVEGVGSLLNMKDNL